MAEARTSIVTNAVKRALEFQERMEARLDEELGRSIGYEEVTRRKCRGLVRRVMFEQDQAALKELMYLGQINGHQPEESVPCPVCREVNVVLDKIGGMSHEAHLAANR